MKLKSMFLTGCAFVLLAVPALAGKSSVDMGEQLFKDPGLAGSSNEKSCNTCHAGGKGLEQADSGKLVQQIKRCMSGPMESTPLDGRTVEMKSLKLYIESLRAAG